MLICFAFNQSCTFCRLVDDEERRWTDENIDMVALKHFPNIDKDKALNRPILYSNWLSKVNWIFVSLVLSTVRTVLNNEHFNSSFY